MSCFFLGSEVISRRPLVPSSEQRVGCYRLLPRLCIDTPISRALCMRTAPSGHPESQSRSAELAHLKAKIDAGADYIITQVRHLPCCVICGLPRRSTLQLSRWPRGVVRSCLVIGHVVIPTQVSGRKPPQMFFKASDYTDYVRECRAAGASARVACVLLFSMQALSGAVAACTRARC